MPQNRHTSQRQAILRAVKLSPEPLYAAEVWAAVRVAVSTISKGTVYRNLESLVEDGEIYRDDGPDGRRQYLGRSDHRTTFTCQRCGAVRRLNSRTLPQYVDRKMFGDQIIFVSHLRASGLCAACAKKLHRS